MPSSATPVRTRPPLPRLVEQVRILLWFQFFATLIYLLALLVNMGLLNNSDEAAFGDFPLWTAVEDRMTQMLIIAAYAVVSAILLAVSAAAARRRWVALYPLVLCSEVSVVIGLVAAIRAGLYAGFGVVLSLLLGVWILIDLFRAEVRTSILRRRSPS